MIRATRLMLLATPTWTAQARAAPPNCADVEAWPASMAYAALKNAGDLTPETVDFAHSISLRIASEQIGRDRYLQVNRVTFPLKDGRTFVGLTVSDASREECSMGEVEVFVVGKRLR